MPGTMRDSPRPPPETVDAAMRPPVPRGSPRRLPGATPLALKARLDTPGPGGGAAQRLPRSRRRRHGSTLGRRKPSRIRRSGSRDGRHPWHDREAHLPHTCPYLHRRSALCGTQGFNLLVLRSHLAVTGPHRALGPRPRGLTMAPQRPNACPQGDSGSGTSQQQEQAKSAWPERGRKGLGHPGPASPR